MKITWLGHSGFIWEAEGTRILIDPFLEGNPQAPCGVEDIPKTDMILVTHTHGDHGINEAIRVARRDDAIIVGMHEVTLLYHPTIFFCPIGSVYTMDAKQAVRAIEFIRPGIVTHAFRDLACSG